MDLDINIFLRIIPDTPKNIRGVFLNQIYAMHMMNMNDVLKKEKIQELKDQVILYITSRTGLTTQVDQELATNAIQGNYTLIENFLTEASIQDPNRGILTDTRDRVNAIIDKTKLRVKRMGLLLEVINEWNSLSSDQQKEEIYSFSTSLNQGEFDTSSDEETQQQTQQQTQQGTQIRGTPLKDSTNTKGGFKYTSRNKKKKQKKSKKRRKKSKKRSKKSKQKRKKKKTRTK